MKSVLGCSSHLFLCTVLIAALSTQVAFAEETDADAHSSNSVQPTKQVNSKDVKKSSILSKRAPTLIGRKAELEEILKIAQTAYAHIADEIDDYTCTLYRREYVDGKVTSLQIMSVKIRHEKKEDGVVTVPFSVYLQFLRPKRLKGRAVLYVQNRNYGDLIARRGGQRSPNMTVQLSPTGPMAMEGNRYPITEIGVQNLTKRLIGVLEQEKECNDGVAEVFEDAKVGNRMCTHYRLTHNDRRPGLRYHMAEVSVDNELGIPIRYGAYDFPKAEGGKRQLLELYVYADIHINVGLTDEDFDPRNPAYQFQLYDDDEEELSKK